MVGENIFLLSTKRDVVGSSKGVVKIVHRGEN